MWLVSLGVAAYIIALLFPSPVLLRWYMVMPLIWFSGLLLLCGAALLPARPIVWLPIRLAIACAAIHWTLVLPLAHWKWL